MTNKTREEAEKTVEHLPDEYDTFFEPDIPSNFSLKEHAKSEREEKMNTSLMEYADDEIESSSTNPDNVKLDNDFTRVRDSQRELIETTKSAIAETINLAESSQSPRAWEVVQQLLKTQSEISKDLLSAHETRDKIKNKREPVATTQNQQNNYYMSPADAIAQLQEAQEKEINENNG